MICRVTMSWAIVVAGLCGGSRAAAQFPALGQTDTFQSNTLENWTQGPSSPVGALVVTTGGPAGAGDLAMQIRSTGVGNAGSRLVAFNRTQWVGNYTAAGVNTIEMDLKSAATNTATINMRIGLQTSGSGYVSTVSNVLPNDGVWHHFSFAITQNAMTAVGVPDIFSTFISSPQTELRLFSAASANTFQGDFIPAIVTVDNIKATFIPVPEPAGLVAATLLACGGVRLLRRRSAGRT